MKIWFKWIGLFFAAVVVLFVGFVIWLLNSEAGARFALARAQGALDSRLTVEHVSGTLAGPLILDGVRYLDAQSGIDAHVGHVSADIALSKLLGFTVRLNELAVDDLNVALTTVPPKPELPTTEVNLKSPIDIELEKFALRRAQISQDGKPIVVIDSLGFAAAWTSVGIVIKQLELRSPDGSVDLEGTLSTAAGYSGAGTVAFTWRVADNNYVGTLKANSDGKLANVDIGLTAPTVVTAVATIGQSESFPWTLKLDAPRFDPKALLPDTALKSLAASLQGSGDINRGSLTGTLSVNDHAVQIEPLKYALTGDVLHIETLTLKAPEATGSLTANGEVRLKAIPVSATLAVNWEGVNLPADLVGQPLATHGRLDFDGSAESYRADSKLSIGPPGKLSDLALKLNGTPKLITLEQLALNQANGRLDAHGSVTLQPAIGWQIDATAKKLDPGAFAADWPGALDFVLATSGHMTDDGPEATVKLDKLSGTLRKKPVLGNADISFKPGYIVDGTAALSSNKSSVVVVGKGGTQTDATATLNVASLGDWLPNASGQANGEFRLHGKWPALDIDGQASGTALAIDATHIGSLKLAIDVNNIDKPNGSVAINASEVVSGSAHFTTVALDASGNEGAHKLTLDAQGTPANVSLALSGSAVKGNWTGQLSTLELVTKDLPRFALAQQTQLAWDGKKFSATDTCLVGDKTRICVAGSGGADGSLTANYRLTELPLALIGKLGAPEAPIVLEGVIDGSGDIQRDAKGALNGHASITSSKGNAAYAVGDGPGQIVLSYTDFSLDAQLAPGSTRATVRALLDHDGRLDGRIDLSGPAGAPQGLGGELNLKLNSLAFAELFSSEIANTKGRVEANYTFAGTTAAPQINGALSLKEFATEIPVAGLKLLDGDISLRAQDAQHFALDGTIGSGTGTLKVNGNGGIGAGDPMKITLSGENIIAADIPAAQVTVSPDLVIERNDTGLVVTGTIGIPKANVDLAKLPGGGVSKTSPDVVIVDAEQAAPGTPLPITVSVKVTLGDDVKLAGLGFDGTVQGNLGVSQRPGRTPTGTGTLNVGGTYRAYGQNLKIETGRILFAGTALDNPGLDIRAVRKIEADNVTAGLMVRGTALVPVLTVISDPVMEQSEALSYLITGKPLSSLKSGEGDMLGTAARALGTAGGDLLAKRIGSRIGVDDIGVSDNAALGGAAFTVGKYLSPKLYLSYGVGVFEPGEVVTLRYLFNRKWNFETQSATTGNRAGINYRFEN
ncbi:MAG: translocation/assembly module TamB domain-containing protein [Dokdonella sp.]